MQIWMTGESGNYGSIREKGYLIAQGIKMTQERSELAEKQDWERLTSQDVVVGACVGVEKGGV